VLDGETVIQIGTNVLRLFLFFENELILAVLSQVL
jgi:hypothetical protein